MFNKTRLKLTAWYLLVIMMVSVSFSGVIYRVISDEVARATHFQQMRLERRFINTNNPLPPMFIDKEIISEVNERLIISLIIVNSGIFIISGALGYLLAGRTLKPIQEMLDEQNRFISDSSHELRTPLTSLKTSMEVALMNKELTVKESRELIKENLEDVDHLKRLSDDLLTLAQYQNKIQPVFEKVAIKTVIEKSVQQVMPLAKSKKITIDQTSIKNFNLHGIKDNLTELFVIIIDNAIKYSPDNTKISIATKKIDGTIKVTVSDQGYGIDKKDLPHIFERFYRADSSRTKKTATGFGLGLSIAKKIVDSHHGKISVFSEIGKGTDFIIKLPS